MDRKPPKLSEEATRKFKDKKDNYYIECLAMAIVNHTNEVNDVSVETRQKNNDECFDYAVAKIKEFISTN